MNKYKKTRISQSLFRFLILFLVTLAVTTTVAWLNHYLFIAVFSLGLGLGFGISIWLLWEQRITQQIKDYQNPYEQNSQQLPEPRTQHNSQVVEIESYKKAIADLKHKINYKERDYDKNLKNLQCQLVESKNRNNSQVIEIESYKKTISDLRHEVNHKERDYDKNLKNLQYQLVKSKNQNNSQVIEIESYQETVADLNQKLSETSNQNESKIAEIKSLRETADNLEVKLNKEKEQNTEYNSQLLSKEILFALLPDIEFLRNSIDIICEDLQSPVRVIKQIKAIDTGSAVGKKINATGKDWFENRVEGNGDWRIYFRRDNQKSKFKIYIAHKKSQNKDFDWLKYQ